MSLLVASALAAALPSLDAPHRTEARTGDVAVVVGLEDYAFVSDVPYARHDGTVAGDLFVYTLGVAPERLILLSGGGREQIQAAVQQAGQQAGPGARVWFYFAGHGAASPSTGKRLLLGDDVRGDAASFDARGVPVEDIVAWASAAGAEPVLLLDTCYTGTGRDGLELLEGARLAVPSYVPTTSTGVIWTAAGADQTSGPLPGVDHGAFTYFAVGALRGWADGELDGVPDGRVELGEAQAFVRRQLAVAQVRGQVPSVSGATVRPLSTGSERMDELASMSSASVVDVVAPRSALAAVRMPRIKLGEGVALRSSGAYETRYAPGRGWLVAGGVLAGSGGAIAAGTWARHRFGEPMTDEQFGTVKATNIAAGGVFLTGLGFAALGLLPSPSRPVVPVDSSEQEAP